tara:strand:+ start:1213 stop:1839 length:627 start_codon:yes stop_codon:yes gene_type:complete
METGHGSALVPLIRNTMVASKIDFAQLNLVAVTTGPGSFTGLRISLSAAKGIALSMDIPLIGISCFEAIAQRTKNQVTISENDLLILALDSKREDFYLECLSGCGTKIFDQNTLSLKELRHKIEEVCKPGKTIHIAGEAASAVATELKKSKVRCLKILVGSCEGVDAVDIAQLADREARLPQNRKAKYNPGVKLHYHRKPDILLPGSR